jgi:hypothetical protein
VDHPPAQRRPPLLTIGLVWVARVLTAGKRYLADWRSDTDSATPQRISSSISSRGVGSGAGTSAASCAGGSHWTVVISRADGSVSQVDAYQCGTAVTGNAGGDLAGFISDLQQLP